jgi:hypothetical protein
MMDVKTEVHDLRHALSRIRSLHDGDLAVIEVIAHGPSAIPHLRTLLFEREPSGLFDTRCRVVHALSALGARDVLIEFLTQRPQATDPIERIGDDAVINAAARTLANYRDESVFQLLLSLARQRLLPGVIAALGSFRRSEAIPHLVDALAEDECRLAAEGALEKLGSVAHDALTATVTNARSPPESESPSSKRQRQSALGLLVRMAHRTRPTAPVCNRSKNAAPILVENWTRCAFALKSGKPEPAQLPTVALVVSQTS